MIPSPAEMLTDLATRITSHLGPALYSNFSQADAGLISTLMTVLAQDYERAVSNRILDIEEMCEIFTKCPEQAPAANQRKAFAKQTPKSLHLVDVTDLHRQGFEILIDLHAWSEGSPQDVIQQSINRDIWALLRRHSERNKFELPIN
ncbi:MAG: hypothetical protein GXP16_04990 [Gammaproteobacteria bacterium]|nr:hypothetical protein [Gammaproteobacteria bacterium]